MGDKLVNECCQTRTCHGKPAECNLDSPHRESLYIFWEENPLFGALLACCFSANQDNLSVVVFVVQFLLLTRLQVLEYTKWYDILNLNNIHGNSHGVCMSDCCIIQYCTRPRHDLLRHWSVMIVFHNFGLQIIFPFCWHVIMRQHHNEQKRQTVNETLDFFLACGLRWR